MKKKTIRILSIFLAVLTAVSSLAVTAYALNWDGSSAGGGGAGTSAGPNGYAIMTTDDNCMIGYRFSVVDKNGGTKNGKVIDVYRSTRYANQAFNWYKFTTKWNKKQLKDNQNSGFSTSKTTANCYKEADMGFAQSLPVTSGMSAWQNDTRNLNPVLSKLGIGGISSLKNGDKVLVEPIYDVRLESVWHSLTVTEIALYGKHILGANSNGGASKTSASWGFISEYTNRHFPNALYTPDGQGLWSGVGKLSKRASFYTIINDGYGVGIAYTETKPDFTPTLSVRCCEAWPGNISVRNNNHYGISYGSSFSNWTYGHGYPQTDSSVWYALNFPAESQNCYVKQSVWVVGGGSTSRNVWSNSNTWYDVKLNPTTIGNGTDHITVKARADWIDGNGNVLKYGPEKTFYIPIRPIVTRDSITAYGIDGAVQATANASGTSGAMYFGQKVHFTYNFGGKNEWTSANNLRGQSYRWNGSAWDLIYKSGNGEDVYVDNANLSKYSSYSAKSAVRQYLIPLNDNEDANSYKMKFNFRTYWASDTAHTGESTDYYLNIVKPDVALEDIRLVNEDGEYVDPQKLEVADEITVRYVYKNNTDCTVYVKGYMDGGSQIPGTYAIPANGTIEIEGYTFTVPNKRTFTIWGGVYLDTVERGNTDYETDRYNNAWLRVCKSNHPIKIVPITPNAPYRENTRVISSFYIKNQSYDDYTPSSNLKVKFTVYDQTKKHQVYSATKNVIVPARDKNLVSFDWYVPNRYGNNRIYVDAEVIDDGKVYNPVSRLRTTKPKLSYTTPDTTYERSAPTGFTKPADPTETKAYTTWWQYEYKNNNFEKVYYGIGINPWLRKETLPATGATATQSGSGWTMKSGYGLSLYDCNVMTSVSGYETPAYGSGFTVPQYSYALFPEYNYQNAAGKITTLQSKIIGNYSFWIFPNVGNVENVHYTPVWYPDGKYSVKVVKSDAWTPMGMLMSEDVISNITLSGNMYDDWYVGRK